MTIAAASTVCHPEDHRKLTQASGVLIREDSMIHGGAKFERSRPCALQGAATRQSDGPSADRSSGRLRSDPGPGRTAQTASWLAYPDPSTSELHRQREVNREA